MDGLIHVLVDHKLYFDDPAKKLLIKYVIEQMNGVAYEYRKIDKQYQLSEAQLDESRLSMILKINPHLDLATTFQLERLLNPSSNQTKTLALLKHHWQILPKNLQLEILDWINGFYPRALSQLSKEKSLIMLLKEGYTSSDLNHNRRYLSDACIQELDSYLASNSKMAIVTDDEFKPARNWQDDLPDLSKPLVVDKMPDVIKKTFDKLAKVITKDFIEDKIRVGWHVNHHKSINPDYREEFEAYDDACNCLDASSMASFAARLITNDQELFNNHTVEVECLKCLRSCGYSVAQVMEWIHLDEPSGSQESSFLLETLRHLKSFKADELINLFLRAGYSLELCAFDPILNQVQISRLIKTSSDQILLSSAVNFMIIKGYSDEQIKSELMAVGLTQEANTDAMLHIHKFRQSKSTEKSNFSQGITSLIAMLKSGNMILGALRDSSEFNQSASELILNLADQSGFMNEQTHKQLISTIRYLIEAIKDYSERDGYSDAVKSPKLNQMSQYIGDVLMTWIRNGVVNDINFRSYLSLSEEGLDHLELLLPKLVLSIVEEEQSINIFSKLLGDVISGSFQENLSVPNLVENIFSLLQNSPKLRSQLVDQLTGQKNPLIKIILADYLRQNLGLASNYGVLKEAISMMVPWLSKFLARLIEDDSALKSVQTLVVLGISQQLSAKKAVEYVFSLLNNQSLRSCFLEEDGALDDRLLKLVIDLLLSPVEREQDEAQIDQTVKKNDIIANIPWQAYLKLLPYLKDFRSNLFMKYQTRPEAMHDWEALIKKFYRLLVKRNKEFSAMHRDYQNNQNIDFVFEKIASYRNNIWMMIRLFIFACYMFLVRMVTSYEINYFRREMRKLMFCSGEKKDQLAKVLSNIYEYSDFSKEYLAANALALVAQRQSDLEKALNSFATNFTNADELSSHLIVTLLQMDLDPWFLKFSQETIEGWLEKNNGGLSKAVIDKLNFEFGQEQYILDSQKLLESMNSHRSKMIRPSIESMSLIKKELEKRLLGWHMGCDQAHALMKKLYEIAEPLLSYTEMGDDVVVVIKDYITHDLTQDQIQPLLSADKDSKLFQAVQRQLKNHEVFTCLKHLVEVTFMDSQTNLFSFDGMVKGLQPMFETLARVVDDELGFDQVTENKPGTFSPLNSDGSDSESEDSGEGEYGPSF